MGTKNIGVEKRLFLVPKRKAAVHQFKKADLEETSARWCIFYCTWAVPVDKEKVAREIFGKKFSFREGFFVSWGNPKFSFNLCIYDINVQKLFEMKDALYRFKIQSPGELSYIAEMEKQIQETEETILSL